MNKTKVLSYGTGAFLSLIGLGAIAAGMGLVLEPDGSGLGMSLDLLRDSPFEDFLIPGITLLAVNGICSLIAALLSFINHRFAGKITGLLGVAMIIWISAQVYWIGWESWLEPTFLVVGVVEMILGYFLNALNPDNHGLFTGHHGTHAH
ncbi:hypothetical protein ABES02_22700 [Neobacillus pocheonensis]|uniref:hypothetical protein n=1 Tax=Neobacillus pocheonensis TaxID=363869 RepID=UPI003D2A2DAA